jgi:hypothetical protein
VEGPGNGRWRAVTALTPLRSRAWVAWLRVVFAFGSRTNILVGGLIKLRVIALGRWTLLARPHNPPALVFETVWTGNPESYIPDFAMVMPLQWRGIWAGAEGFPGPRPAEGLLAFVREHDWGADHFFTGYTKGATTEIVVRALELDRRVERASFLTLRVSVRSTSRCGETGSSSPRRRDSG